MRLRRCPKGGWCRWGIHVEIGPAGNGQRKPVRVRRICWKCKRLEGEKK